MAKILAMISFIVLVNLAALGTTYITGQTYNEALLGVLVGAVGVIFANLLFD